ncbi:MAG: polysaccharide deacetylase family protein [Treponema sp.]|jgi:peptidoglycan/xylan/chitin deacetylase (PgdA/CDA1 family)|nr:polysaccharide deacetylase family protein [Treponema sp.]
MRDRSIQVKSKTAAFYYPRALPVLLVSVVFFSCAGSRGMVRRNTSDILKDKTAIPPAIDRVVELVGSDSEKIRKYFVTDEQGLISVRADIWEGDAEFEVRYDLEGPEDSKNQADRESLRVEFSVEDKQTGETREGSFLWPLREDAAGLLLAFDDDFRPAWEEHFDTLDAYGARVTYFVQGELSDFCFRALNRGHDIGYHTIHHLNLPKVSEEEFYQETTSGIGAFRHAGIPLKTFAYPFGLSEPWMREALAGTFAIQRGFGATFRVYTTEAVREGYIVARSIDNILFKEEEAFEAVITGMFRTLKFIGGERVLPVTTHDISDTAQWGIKPRRLEYLLETARSLKLKFYRYSDFVRDL